MSVQIIGEQANELSRLQTENDVLAARLAKAERKIAAADKLLRPLHDCDPDIREWLGMPRWTGATDSAPAESALRTKLAELGYVPQDADAEENLRQYAKAMTAHSAPAAPCSTCRGEGFIRVVHSPHDEEFPPCPDCTTQEGG